jgi:nucleoside-diphosphate-sugar epimerase
MLFSSFWRLLLSKVLIVGGAGYVGGYMVDYAISAGHDVRVIDNLTYEDKYLKDVDFHYVDILDFSTVEKHLQWADTVVWLAAFVGDAACAINPNLTWKTNVKSIQNLVNSFGGRIVFPSTCSVYGAQNSILDENSLTSPLSLYAESKLEAENILTHAENPTLIFRLGTLFGMSDKHSRLRVDLVLNTLTIRAVLEGTMSVFGGNQFRPLLHVRDVATAAVPHFDSSTEGIFNLHTENVTILELAKRIQSIVPESIFETTEVSFQDARNYQVDSTKAKEFLNFEPKWSIEAGIIEVANVISSKRIKNSRNPRFSNSEALTIQLGGGLI